jgi:hypothetical protein
MTMETDQKEVLSSKLDRNKTRVINTFENIKKNEWNKIVYKEQYLWDCRDLLAHFASSEEFLLKLLKSIESGGKGLDKSFNYDEFNKEENAKYKQFTPQKLLKIFVTNRNRTIAWTNNIDENVLVMEGMQPTLGEITLQEIIMSIYSHLLMHLRDL